MSCRDLTGAEVARKVFNALDNLAVESRGSYLRSLAASIKQINTVQDTLVLAKAVTDLKALQAAVTDAKSTSMPELSRYLPSALAAARNFTATLGTINRALTAVNTDVVQLTGPLQNLYNTTWTLEVFYNSTASLISASGATNASGMLDMLAVSPTYICPCVVHCENDLASMQMLLLLSLFSCTCILSIH